MRGQQTAKKPAPKDWHKADIKAALEKSGWSLRQLAAELDVSPSTLRDALRFPYPASELRIANAIGAHPMVIWPTRYDDDGRPIDRKLRSNRQPHRNRSTGIPVRRGKGAGSD